MKHLAARILGALLNAWYVLCQAGGREDRALFLSRQSNAASLDFQLLLRELETKPGWTAEVRTKMIGGGISGAASFMASMLGDVRALARCRVCFVEGYNPALSLLDMDYGGAAAVPGYANGRFPERPVVMQVWHAAGHFKKFGFEALGTAEGRSVDDARTFRMHRNYSWVACSGEGAREGFAEAFGCPPDRVVALGHPSFDELYEPADEALRRVDAAYPALASEKRPVVLVAPTLHRRNGADLIAQLRAALESDPRAGRYAFLWSLHPVNATVDGQGVRVTTRDLLRRASIVVTDYSSVVYDAAILDVPFAFYTPDIEEYRRSPGLATDPGELAPGLCLDSPDTLLRFLDATFADGNGASAYPVAQRDAFVGTTLSACGPGSASRIVEFALDHVHR